MDDQFFNDLEQALTGVGTDIVWERKIGGHVFRFSPISYESRLKVNDTLQNSDLGSVMLAETKRITLSHAICGFDGNDFTQYRKHGHRFQVPDRSKPGNLKKVSFNDWLYEKIMSWDDQLVMDCFSVYADLMETHQNNNLKEVKFENLTSPYEEMIELMGKLAEVRDRLGLPQLVDPTSEDYEAITKTKEPDEVKSEPSSKEPSSLEVPDSRSPFDPIPKHKQEFIQSLNQDISDSPNVPSIPNKIEENSVQETSHQKPFSLRSNDDVLDKPMEIPKTKPIIDSPSLNANPRFHPPRRS